jgi:HK97 family phage major capsid protein
MRFAISCFATVLAVIMAALAPAISVFHRWMIEEPRQRTSVLLRKVKGISGATAMFGRNRPSFSHGFGLVGSMTVAGFMFALGIMALGAIVLACHASPLYALATPPVITGARGQQLRDVEGKVKAKHDLLDSIFTAGGSENDWNKPEVLKAASASSSAEVVEKVRATNKELEDLVKEREGIAELARIEDAHNRRKSAPATDLPFPGNYRSPEEREERKLKSFGQAIVESEAFTGYKKNKQPTEVLVKDFGLHEMKHEAKTLFETGAGWAPSSPRSNIVIDKAIRPIQVLDIIPTGTMENATLPYMEETTHTNNATERAEGAAYPESVFALTERTETARAIGNSVPVTDEQLEDVSAAASYLDRRLRFGVLQRMDYQVVLGNGTPPNLQGIKTKSGVTANSGSGITKMDAMFKAMTKVRVTGRGIPSAHIIHPTDWEEIILTKTADGIYIFANPSSPAPDRLWGLPVAQFDADSAGISYTGDFLNFTQLFERRGMEVAVGYVGSQFTEGKKTIRAGIRVALAVYRAAAIVKTTF